MSTKSHLSIQAMQVRNVEEATQAKETLWKLQSKLGLFIARANRKKEAPTVKLLNRHLAKGEALYYEYGGGKYRSVCIKGGSIFRSKPSGGICRCGSCDDPERYSAIDLIYKLNLDGPSELLYERRKP